MKFFTTADSLYQIILRKVHPLGSLAAIPYTEEKLALRHIKFLTFNLAFLALRMKFHISLMKNMTAYLIIFEKFNIFSNFITAEGNGKLEDTLKH